jgi:hypothetical protein
VNRDILKHLEFTKHHKRLAQLQMATLYTIAALDEKHETDQPKFERWATENLEKLTAVIPESQRDEANLSEVLGTLKESVQLAPSAKPLVLSLALVSLCTELEVFVSHLVRVILASTPALVKSLASDKSLTGAELADCSSYQQVSERLHSKIIKEIIDSGTRKMIISHLGKRVDLFHEQDLVFTLSKYISQKLPTAPGSVRNGLGELVQAFQQRHSIVHEGALPVQEPRVFQEMHTIFGWFEVFLSVRAVRKYPILVDGLDWLAAVGCMYGVTNGTDLNPMLPFAEHRLSISNNDDSSLQVIDGVGLKWPGN